jgi:hypothetical protein
VEDSRLRLINQGKSKASILAIQALKDKRALAENVQTRKILRADIDKFRQTIRAHLLDSSKLRGVKMDIGAVMRCIDDAMLFEFMTTYSGYKMSIDAILTYIGNTVGSTGSEVELAVPSERLNADYGTRQAPGRYEQINIPLEKQIPSERTLSRHELNRHPDDTSAYFPPRRYSFDKGRVPDDPVLGSGFHLRPQQHIAAISPGDDPGLLFPGTLSSVLERINVETKILAKKPQNPTYRYDMFDAELRDAASLALSDGDYDSHVRDTIDVMNRQLMEERLLPSLLPDRAISDRQLRELGMGDRDFESIMIEIEQGLRGSSSPGHTFDLTGLN